MLSHGFREITERGRLVVGGGGRENDVIIIKLKNEHVSGKNTNAD